MSKVGLRRGLCSAVFSEHVDVSTDRTVVRHGGAPGILVAECPV